MPDIKIIKSIAKDCDLKNERNARVRDSKFNNLKYYGGHIELVKDQIDTVKLQGVVRKKGEVRSFSLQELMTDGLDVYDSLIGEIIVEHGCWLHLYRGAKVEKLVCRYSGSEASINGEAVIEFLGLADGGTASAKHGQIDQVHVGRGGKLHISERVVISQCEVVPNGILRVGYRYSRAQSVPVIHKLKACADSAILFKGDCCIGELEVCCNAKIQRQFCANVCIGKLFEQNRPVTNVTEWLHRHSVDFIS